MTVKPNLVVGLVCPAGTDLAELKQQLRGQLAIVGYTYKDIKVSGAIAAALKLSPPVNEYERMRQLMAGGDLIRQNSTEGSGVASLIVTALRAERGEDPIEDSSIVYVIDSLKNPKELEILDQLYGRNFYSISINAPKSDRRIYLANKIARSRKQPLEEIHFSQADELIDLDQKGEDDTGQSVRDTFPKSDFFVESALCATEIKRFVRLIFKDPFITPTLDEYAMFIARATALRSCDLSRQVGGNYILDLATAVGDTGFSKEARHEYQYHQPHLSRRSQGACAS